MKSMLFISEIFDLISVAGVFPVVRVHSGLIIAKSATEEGSVDTKYNQWLIE